MKKLLFFLLIFAGINCQAQESSTYTEAFKGYLKTVNETFKDIYSELIQRTAHIQALSDIVSKRDIKIQILEDRIIELEKKVDGYLQDSIIEHSLFQTSKWEDSNDLHNYFVPNPDDMIFISIKDLFDYQKECYNDSTLQVISADVIVFTDPKLTEQHIPLREHWYYTGKQDSVSYHYEWVNTLKTPTFEGFIKYIKQLKETDK